MYNFVDLFFDAGKSIRLYILQICINVQQINLHPLPQSQQQFDFLDVCFFYTKH